VRGKIAERAGSIRLEDVQRLVLERRNVLFVQRQGDAPSPQAAIAGVDEIRVLAAIPVDRRDNATIDYPALRKLVGA
jgi:hypothetical protein